MAHGWVKVPWIEVSGVDRPETDATHVDLRFLPVNEGEAPTETYDVPLAETDIMWWHQTDPLNSICAWRPSRIRAQQEAVQQELADDVAKMKAAKDAATKPAKPKKKGA